MTCYIVLNVIIVVIIMLTAWVWYLIKKNPGVIDMFWSIAITFSGGIALYSGLHSTVQLIAGLLLLTWGIRLAAYLFFTRVLPNHVDKRYLSLSSDWKVSKALGFLANYLLQGLLAMLIALPFWWVRQETFFSAWTVLGILLVIIGIIFESIADYQLNQFKKKHDGGVCNKGLWHYSRHPNYFFEWLIWVGFSAMAFSMPYGFLSLVSPLLLLGIMLFITVPITEKQSLESRGEAFEKYQEKTAMFFPLPPRQ